MESDTSAQQRKEDDKEVVRFTPHELRSHIRQRQWDKPTAGLAQGYAQANLVILPRELAYDFLLFCQRNPKPCPLLEVTEVGSPHLEWLAADTDLRTDIPRYRIYRRGELVGEVNEITSWWNDNLVAFLLGCSFTFEAELVKAGLPIRHIEEEHNVPMYITNVPTRRAGPFQGPLVVTMRPFTHQNLPRATVITSQYSRVHGAPIHIGDPAIIGIKDLNHLDFGQASTVHRDEVPVFWACGVTAQAIAIETGPELMITHAPGYMFVSDRLNGEFTNL